MKKYPYLWDFRELSFISVMHQRGTLAMESGYQQGHLHTVYSTVRIAWLVFTG
jgi:hypothetical protein